jgi:hypothetical protein
MLYLLIAFSLQEVPQEHSHDLIVNTVRTVYRTAAQEITKVDPIFALLANPGATKGIQSSGANLPASQRDPNCLQMHIADTCLTNGKATNAPREQLAACIQFRALERNTLRVGQASELCTQEPVNSELRGLTQHQDPAGQDASSTNRNVELEVARRIKALGFSDLEAAHLALRTATFTPGSLTDTSGRANTCDGPFGVDPQTLSGDQFRVFADQEGQVFGLRFRSGDLVDCSTLATAKNILQGKMVPAISLQELLSALGGSPGLSPTNTSRSPVAQLTAVSSSIALPQITAASGATVAPTPTPQPTSSSEQINGRIKTITLTQSIDCSQTPLPRLNNDKQSQIQVILNKAEQSQQKLEQRTTTAVAQPTGAVVDPARVARAQAAQDEIKRLFDDLTKQTAEAAAETQRLIQNRAPQAEIDLAFDKATQLDTQKDIMEARFDRARRELQDAREGR